MYKGNKRSWLGLALSAVMLAACAVQPTAVPKATPVADSPNKAKPGVSDAAAATASNTHLAASQGDPSPSSGVSPTGAPTFPPIPTTLIRGSLKLDASYLVTTGAGKLVAAGGGNVVAAGAGNLIGLDGGTLIGQDGASLIGLDGASLIGLDGGSYHLAGAPHFRLSDTVPLPPGTQLPAAHMRIRAFDLATGKSALAARDPDAREKAYTLTDGRGTFSIPILKEMESRNILIVADVPFQTDSRFQLTYLKVPEKTTGLIEMDERVAAATRVIRVGFADRLTNYLFDAETVTTEFEVNINGVDGLTNEMLKPLILQAKADRVSSQPEVTRRYIAQRMADYMLAGMGPMADVELVSISGPLPEALRGRPAFAVLLEGLDKQLKAAEAKMAADPAFFDKLAAAADTPAGEQLAECMRLTKDNPAGQFHIARPADVPLYFIFRYLSATRGRTYGDAVALYDALGIPQSELDTLRLAVDGIVARALLPVVSHTAIGDDPRDPTEVLMAMLKERPPEGQVLALPYPQLLCDTRR